MQMKKFDGVMAFTAGHAKVLVFMALGFSQFDAVDLAHWDHIRGIK